MDPGDGSLYRGHPVVLLLRLLVLNGLFVNIELVVVDIYVPGGVRRVGLFDFPFEFFLVFNNSHSISFLVHFQPKGLQAE